MMLHKPFLHFAIAAIVSCLTLWTGCSTSPHESATPRESSDQYRPDWLPKSAEITFTSHWKDGLLPDATFKLKARVKETDFAAIIKQLNLTPHTKDRNYSDEIGWLQWMRDSDIRWDPSPSIDETFVRQEGDWWQLAKYQNGFLYYQSLNH